MVFAGINILAVLVAAFLAFAFGAVYYSLLSKPWMKAGRIDPSHQKNPMWRLLAISFVGEVVMAYVLAGTIAHLGAADVVTIKNGIVTALFVSFGFVLPTLIINQRYQGYGWTLTLIDGGHWLGVLLIIGITLGAFGV